MFRSKLFTVAFSILSVLIVGLIVIFCYLVFGNGKAKLEQAYTGTTSPENTENTDFDPNLWSDTDTTAYEEAAFSDTEAQTSEVTTEPTTETTEETTEEIETEPIDTTVRALKSDEPHSLPIVGQDIAEMGWLTIMKSGDNGEGIVFHGSPQFDAADSPGNVTNYSGTFDITDKIYILNNGTPFLMYKTLDGYYVTSSEVYVHFDPAEGERTIGKDDTKRGDYGLSEGEEIVVRVYHEDGSHIAFSMFNYSPASGELMPVLENVIAEYTSNGVANFEYHNSDGLPHRGTIAFETVQGAEYSKRVDVTFESPVTFRLGERSEVVLHN